MNVVLEDHVTFQKVLKATKHDCDGSSTESSSYESSTSDESSITTVSTEISDEVPIDVKIQEAQRKLDYYHTQALESNKKIASLTLQLNRAESSESALAIAVNDIETQRLALEKYFMEKRQTWKKLPHKEQELRAQVEVEMMNEVMSVTKRMEELNRNHNLVMRQKEKQVKELKTKLSQWEKSSSGGKEQVFYSD